MERLASGTVIAERYELGERLGAGAMGEVYRAVDRLLRREVAIKVLGAGVRGELEARFAREARAIARLDHPGCVRILDVGRSGGRAFLAMELLAGDTLADVLDTSGPMSISRATYLADKLLAAIGHAHAHGVWHRDLKPENIILVTRGGLRPVLIDFGLACLHDAAALTQQGVCVGSPSYVAPERLRGEPADGRADLYAIGVILYELLAGCRPFTGPTPRDVMERALTRPARPLRALRPEIPAALEAVVARLLAKAPERRYADATAARAALAEAMDPGAPEASASAAPLASTHIQIPVTRPALWSRVWGWLRYGRWRWRAVSARGAVSIH